MRYLHFMGLLLAFPMSILYGSLNGKIDKNNLSLNSVKEELSKININENVVLLCLLVAISLILLFLLIRIFNQKRKLEHSLKSHKIKEQSQNKFLSDISQKVYKEAKELDKEEKPIIQKIKDENPTKYEKIKELKVALLKNSKELTYFLKLKTNRLEAKLQDFNLEELLTQLVDEIYEQHPKKELDLIFIIEPEIPQNLIGDPQRIYTILHTLIENAIEESTNNLNGEIVVDIRLCKDQKSSSTQIITLCFKIATPISKELKEVIENNFEPYYDDSKNRYIGVHLSFAKDLLDGISGEIWLEKEDKNQFISFKIPVRVDGLINNNCIKLPSHIKGRKKVLIIEKSLKAAISLQKPFEKLNFNCEIITKDIFEKEIPNFIHYDIVAIDEDLFEPIVAEFLKSIKRYHDLKIIAISKGQYKTFPKDIEELIDAKIRRPIFQCYIYNIVIKLYEHQNIKSKSQKEIKSISTKLKNLVSTNKEETKKEYELPIIKEIKREDFNKFAGSTVLIAEDNPINQKMFISLLKDSGINLIVANNGKEALDILEKQKVDLLLLDSNMPIMSGFEAIKKIREDNRFNSLPVIAFTGLSLKSDTQNLLKMGFDGYLSKPLKLNQLYRLFERYLPTNNNHLNGNSNINISLINRENRIKYPILDINEGLIHTNNNKELYIDLLKEFLAIYKDSAKLLSKYLKESNIAQAKNLLFDLKGLLGTIGAIRSKNLVEEIYALIQNDLPITTEHLEAFQEEMEKLIKEINNQIKKES